MGPQLHRAGAGGSRLLPRLLCAAAVPWIGSGFADLGLPPTKAVATVSEVAAAVALAIEAALPPQALVTEVEESSAGADHGRESINGPPRPQVPARFVAPVDFLIGDKPSPGMPGGKGEFVYDLPARAMRVDTSRVMELLSKASDPLYFYGAFLMLDNASFGLNGKAEDAVCRAGAFTGRRFTDMFSWASSARTSRFLGSTTVAGRSCDLWLLVPLLPIPTLVRQTLCANGDIPVEWNQSFRYPGGHFSMSYRFSPPTAVGSQVDPKLLEVPAACRGPAPPCAAGRGQDPRTTTVYVFHPSISKEDYDIEDQDVADVHGDAVFICTDLLIQKKVYVDHNYSRISQYELKVSPAFGQYAMCNGYPDTMPPGPSCVGGDPRLVGKEAPYFAGVGESRCAEKSSIGFWYNLPKAGRCPPGTEPAAGAWASGCTWSVVRRVKTVDQKCLLDVHSFLDSCRADMAAGLGIEQSASALSKVFESEDVGLGGCPDVGGPTGALPRGGGGGAAPPAVAESPGAVVI